MASKHTLLLRMAGAYRRVVPLSARESLRLGSRIQSGFGRIEVARDRKAFEHQRLASTYPDEFPQGRAFPIYSDRNDHAGVASGHYFHQDLLVARAIYASAPRRHIDVGSSIAGFVSHVASFREIEVLDVRPIDSEVPGITFIQQDVMALEDVTSLQADSVSCLHALEHFGLGRYGDSIDYDGWRKGLIGLTRMVESGGTLYLSVPTGEPQRVEFNAHRVFTLPFLRSVLEEHFIVERLAFVLDNGALLDFVEPSSQQAQASFNASYGCSIWVLTKRPLS